MRMDKLVTVQKRNEETEAWENWKQILCRINRSGGSEGYANGTEKQRRSLTFETRYLPDLERMASSGEYRLIYRGQAYNLTEYDDFFESHQTIKMTVQIYGDQP